MSYNPATESPFAQGMQESQEVLIPDQKV